MADDTSILSDTEFDAQTSPPDNVPTSPPDAVPTSENSVAHIHWQSHRQSSERDQ